VDVDGFGITCSRGGIANPIDERDIGARTARRERGIEGQILEVVKVVVDFPVLVAIAEVSGDAVREVVFQFEGVELAVLPQEVVSLILGEIGSGTGAVLRTSRRGVGRRTGCRIECVRSGEQRRGKQLRRCQILLSRNEEVREPEAVHEAELVRHVNGSAEVGVRHHAPRTRWAADQSLGLARARRKPGEVLIPV